MDTVSFFDSHILQGLLKQDSVLINIKYSTVSSEEKWAEEIIFLSVYVNCKKPFFENICFLLLIIYY